jgi:hypothetical protein
MSDLRNDLAQRMYAGLLSAPECDAIAAVVEAAQIWYAGDLSDDMSEEEDHLYIAVEALEKLEWSKIVVEITKMAQEDGELSSPLRRPPET